MLEKHFWNPFLLYLVVEVPELAHETSSFPEMLYKRGDLKNFSKFRDEHKKQSSGGVLSKDVVKNFAKFTDKHLCRSLFLMKLQAGNLKLSEAATGDVLWKKVFLKRCTDVSEQPFIDPLQNRCSWIIHKLHRKKPVLESLFNKVAVLRACNFIK